MKNIYACLIGNWVNLSDDPDCVMGHLYQNPNIWWEENAPIYSPYKKNNEDTFYEENYININYKGVDYRINPIFIQIVTTK